MQTVNTLIGLALEASEESLHSEVLKLLESVKNAGVLQVSLKNRVLELEQVNAAQHSRQVESDLDLHKNRIPASERPKWRAALLQNREEMLHLLATLPEQPGDAVRLDNRSFDPAIPESNFSIRPYLKSGPTVQAVPLAETVEERAKARQARNLEAKRRLEDNQETEERRALSKKIHQRTEQLLRSVKTMSFHEAWVRASKEYGQSHIH